MWHVSIEWEFIFFLKKGFKRCFKLKWSGSIDLELHHNNNTTQMKEKNANKEFNAIKWLKYFTFHITSIFVHRLPPTSLPPSPFHLVPSHKKRWILIEANYWSNTLKCVMKIHAWNLWYCHFESFVTNTTDEQRQRAFNVSSYQMAPIYFTG